ncbi:unnamed protein product [Eruca vesicaria subsp. sativa]|uniref:Transmembrane protein n=1 Tax=Eruca vesicaria subsp. sativa TaxID=29727 RepID=A0ABC8KZU6_ERUVS|nr:unnamed protein product [Eruca vesicaria subsp. sativa]
MVVDQRVSRLQSSLDPRVSGNGGNRSGVQQNLLRSVEERKKSMIRPVLGSLTVLVFLTLKILHHYELLLLLLKPLSEIERNIDMIRIATGAMTDMSWNVVDPAYMYFRVMPSGQSFLSGYPLEGFDESDEEVY